jgi:hypothetical protein
MFDEVRDKTTYTTTITTNFLKLVIGVASNIFGVGS